MKQPGLDATSTEVQDKTSTHFFDPSLPHPMSLGRLSVSTETPGSNFLTEKAVRPILRPSA